MKPYLLNVYTDTPNTERFLQSIGNINVDHIQVKPNRYPGNLSRYSLIPPIMDEKRYVIFTDTEDVIFQKDFPDFNKYEADIILGPENELHKNSYWMQYINKFKVFKPLLDKPIYNAGCYAMKVSKFNEWLKFLEKYKELFGEDCDQLLFNLWLTKENFIADLSIFVPLYANVDKGLVYKEDGVWKTGKGIVINCVHENGIKGRL